ncbi:MAG TPA: hypothetical protein VGF48_20060 [Thermoanaerobaculia bacterium]|jgi:hypothetical protein
MKRLLSNIVISLAIVFPATAFAASPELRFEDRAITIGQVTPGGRVLLCGVAREPLPGIQVRLARVPRSIILTDDDGDGVVRHDLGKTIPHQGMWAAIDMSSGGHAEATTPGYERPPLAITPDLAKHDNNGQLRKLQWPVPEMYTCLVRPGDGAWQLYAVRETEADESGPDEPLRIDIGRFRPLAESGGAPPNFRPGDVLVIFDPTWMKFGAIEVGR